MNNTDTERDQLDGQEIREAMALAIGIGEKLLAGEQVWQHPAKGLGGFSHGAAGVAYALTQLYEACHDGRFLAAARRGWAFQQTLYDATVGNWQDRRGGQPVYLTNWCNGAAGIGLAAAACLNSLPELRDTVDRAAELVIADLESNFSDSLDTLCCGTFGQIESLLEMGLLTGEKDWVEQARLATSRVLERASANGSFNLDRQLPQNMLNPTFFRGVAGIGYTLLRLASVENKTFLFPCIMRWNHGLTEQTHICESVSS